MNKQERAKYLAGLEILSHNIRVQADLENKERIRQIGEENMKNLVSLNSNKEVSHG